MLRLQLVKGHIRAHVDAGADLDPQGEDGGDLTVQQLPGEAVVGDAVAQHAPQLTPLFIHRHLMSHQRQVIGGGEAAGAAAHHRHPLAGGGGAGRLGHLPRLVHGIALQRPDIHRVIHHPAAAAGLTGVLTDVGAGHREGVVLADEPHRVGVPACVDQGDIAGDVHSGGAQGHAGHGVFQAAQAPVAEDMLLIVVPEGLKAHQHQLGGVDADGAVGGVHDGLGRLLDPAEDADVRLAVQHLLQHVGELSQSDAAGHALSAGLGVAQIQKIQSHVDGAQARRAGCDPLLHAPVELIHHRLGLAGGLDVQSAHGSLTPSSFVPQRRGDLPVSAARGARPPRSSSVFVIMERRPQVNHHFRRGGIL